MNEQVFKTVVASFLRHTLTALGGVLIAHGADSAGTLELMSGAASVIAGLVWAYYNKLEVPKA